jgi:hypothetical protein
MTNRQDHKLAWYTNYKIKLEKAKKEFEDFDKI